MNRYGLFLTAVAALLLSGCGQKSSYGFRLPDGNADAGRAAFADLGCYQCHSLGGAESEQGEQAPMTVVLGGEVRRVETYGELVTSIINPSHRISDDDLDPSFLINGQSAMETVQLNGVMTVEQLVDLVAYLQPHYKVPVPQYDPYDYIYP